MKLSRFNGVDILVLLLGLIILSLGIGSYGLYEPHEGHFAGVGAEMVLRQDWVTPTLNGAPYLNKPPLLYWLVAMSTVVFEASEWSARLPLALSGWLAVVVAWKWARELWGGEAGRTAAVMLSTTLGWFIFTHQLLIDVLLATLVSIAYYALWKLDCHPRAHWWFFTLYAVLGLCFLSKGLLGLVLPLLCCCGLALRRGWSVCSKIRLVPGLGITLAVVLPWSVAVERANPGFWFYFFYNEHLQRLADTRWPPDYEVSKVSAIGYLALAAVWCFPWSLLLPQVGTWVVSGAKNEPQKSGLLLLAIATLSPIVLFLPFSSRLVYYSLPALPPYAILCAGWWSTQRATAKVAILFICVGLGLSSTALWGTHLINVLELPVTSSLAKLVLMTVAMGLGLFTGGLLIKFHRVYALAALLVGFVSSYISIVHGFVLYQDVRASKSLVESANARLGSAALWIFEGSRELGTAGAMSYYLNHGKIDQESLSQGCRHRETPFNNRYSSFGQLLPPGWVQRERPYRIVLVLADGGTNRILPQFPGPRPRYAIAKAELQAYWNSSRPVVFVTDFLRRPHDSSDPPDLNLPNNTGKPLLVVGSRKLYGNPAARRLWCD
ncbi:MAG: ArnT family glycosyltransferase [Cyanophyceae cyanobacterium]